MPARDGTIHQPFRSCTIDQNAAGDLLYEDAAAQDKRRVIVDQRAISSFYYVYMMAPATFKFVFIAFMSVCGGLAAQSTEVLAFWNVENLFDTIDDPHTDDEEFTPSGRNKWTAGRYYKKLERLSEVIALLGTTDSPQGAAVVGLCEVENDAVLDDLVAMLRSRNKNYSYVHRDGPDQRGIDVAMLYDAGRFRPDSIQSIRVDLPNGHPTRDILVVSGELDREDVVFIVSHWPSRRGGEKNTRPLRRSAAHAIKRITDSVFKMYPSKSVVVMGDLNDDPGGHTARLLTIPVTDSALKQPVLFNCMEALFRQGIGTLAWNDRWNLFDQVLLSSHFLDEQGWRLTKTLVHNENKLKNASGRYAGYPFRTFAAGVYYGGYSDHFPVYVVLQRL